MKILIYSLNFMPEITGIGKYTGELASYLSTNGHTLKVVTAPPYYPNWKVDKSYSSVYYKREKNNHITVIRCPLYVPSKVSGIKRIVHLLSFAVSSCPIMLANSLWRPDIIITIEPPVAISPASLVTAKLCGAKSWIHIQDFEVDAAFNLGIVPFRFRKYVEQIERFLLSKFTRVSTISENMIKKLSTKGVPSDKSVNFPNWVDTQVIFPRVGSNPMREQLGISEGSVVALYSGNMGEKQGLEIILEAARQLNGAKDFVFVMCGTGAAYERLRATSDDLKNILWIPLQPVERLNDLLNMADIHLLPQRADVADLVMPSKLTGMMASGRPVLATALEGTQIANTLKHSGKIVPPADVNAFVNALCELAQNKEVRERLGAEARQYAVDNWDKGNVLRQFEQSLKNIVYGY